MIQQKNSGKAMPSRSQKPLTLWPTVGLIGWLVVLAFVSITDARPRALARLKETFHQIMQNQGDK